MDLYETLGVAEDASPASIKKAYRRRVLESHPDKGGTSDAFRSVSEAYQILANDETRDWYDMRRTSETSNSGSSRRGSGADSRRGSGADSRRGSGADSRRGSGADSRRGSGADSRKGSFSSVFSGGEKRNSNASDWSDGDWFDCFVDEEDCSRHHPKKPDASDCLDSFFDCLEDFAKAQWQAVAHYPWVPHPFWVLLVACAHYALFVWMLLTKDGLRYGFISCGGAVIMYSIFIASLCSWFSICGLVSL